LQFLFQAASPETFRYTLVIWKKCLYVIQEDATHGSLTITSGVEEMPLYDWSSCNGVNK